jgi:hypothetical protein
MYKIVFLLVSFLWTLPLYSQIINVTAHQLVNRQNTVVSTVNQSMPNPAIKPLEKLELRLRLSDNSFCPNGATSKNPFDPGVIGLEALFTANGVTNKVFGFFKDATQCGTTNPTNYPWVVRFCPPSSGSYNVQIKIYLNNTLNNTITLYSGLNHKRPK